LDLIKEKGRIVGEREREARDVQRGERDFFYVYYIHLDRYSRALYIRLYCSI
jgi:hypothetical protein